MSNKTLTMEEIRNLPPIPWWEKVWYRLIRLWENKFDWYYSIKWFFQRGKRGWSTYDSWSFDTYLAGVMAQAFRHLAKYHHGCPARFLPGFPEQLEHTQEEVDQGCETWKQWLLDKAEWLEWYHKDEDGHTGDTNWINPEIPENIKSQRIDAHHKKLVQFYNEVMVDIAKHWGNLWD